MDSAAEDDVETQWLKLAEARSAELESGKVEGISWRDINQDLT